MAGLLEQPFIWILAILAIVAGLVRGFAGFGAAMLFIPVASAIVGPKIAVVAMWTMDSLPTVPIVIPALRKVSWRTVLPVAAGSLLTVGFSAHLLSIADPEILRWFMSAVVVTLVVLIASGYRYRNAPKPGLSFGVGMVSGGLGGAAQLSGPPVIAYWLSGPDKADRVRANIIVLFAITTIGSGLAFFFNNLLVRDALLTGIVAAPFYMIGLLAGQRGFGFTSELVFRRIAFVLIVVAAFAAMPIFDRLYGS